MHEPLRELEGVLYDQQSHSLHLEYFTIDEEIKIVIHLPENREPAMQKVTRDRSQANIPQEFGRLFSCPGEQHSKAQKITAENNSFYVGLLKSDLHAADTVSTLWYMMVRNDVAILHDHFDALPRL